MNDIPQIIAQAPSGSLSLRSEGPPTFSGEAPRRICIEGTPDAFRRLAEVLLAMAEAVESDPEMRQCGWRLVLDPEGAPALRMDPGTLLALDCDPAGTGVADHG